MRIAIVGKLQAVHILVAEDNRSLPVIGIRQGASSGFMLFQVVGVGGIQFAGKDKARGCGQLFMRYYSLGLEVCGGDVRLDFIFQNICRKQSRGGSVINANLQFVNALDKYISKVSRRSQVESHHRAFVRTRLHVVVKLGFEYYIIAFTRQTIRPLGGIGFTKCSVICARPDIGIGFMRYLYARGSRRRCGIDFGAIIKYKLDCTRSIKRQPPIVTQYGLCL